MQDTDLLYTPAWQLRELLDTRRVSSTELTEMVLRKTPEQHERQIHALVHRPDASAYLDQIACPTLVMVGRQDAWSPVEQHEEMVKLIPDVRLEIIEEAGHFAPVERPNEVADLLVPFLKG